MLLTIILLPFITFIFSGLFGRKLGDIGVSILTSFNLLIITILAHILLYNLIIYDNIYIINIIQWISLGHINIDFSFQFDNLTVIMLLPVLIVSTLVHIYSIGYMEEDPHKQRFFSYLTMFTFFMIILITGNNMLVMFLGWEGVGVSSYLLINFWFTRIQANKSAINAILVNRIGDMFLTIGLFQILLVISSLDYSIILSLSPYINNNILIFIGILLLLGAMAKSSQLGLHIWLPYSMEGPTPVSALIHAATMVTAGVYLLIRISPLIEYSSIILLLILWIGALTSIFAATTGLFQNDIKRIIAFSTTSQLGMLFVAIGLSQANLALFHLVNHAYFKALLFLGAGQIIHSFNDQQDLRKYGGLIYFLPFTYIIILIGSLSLMAIPFLTGFWSKDLIIESAYGHYTLSGHIIYWIITLSALFTCLYSFKLIYLTFLSSPWASLINYINIHEANLTIAIPLFILAIMSIFYGYLFKDLIIGLATPFQNNQIFIHPNNNIILDTEFSLPIIFKLLPLILTLIGGFFSLFIYEYYNLNFISNINKSKFYYNIYSFFNQRYYLDLLINNIIVKYLLIIAYHTSSSLDKGSLEYLGPSGLKLFFSYLTQILSLLDTGKILNYSIYIITSLLFTIILFYFNIISLLFLFIIASFL